MIRILSTFVIVPLMFVACTWVGYGTVRHEIEQIHSLSNLLQVNPHDKKSLDQLISYLNHPNRTLRTQAVAAIGNLGEKHSEVLGETVVPLLIARLKDDESPVRRYAVLALGQYGKKAERAVPGLIEVLRNNKRADSGWFAAEVLGNLGTAADPAVPELIRSLDHRGTSGGIHEFIMAEKAALALYKLSPLQSEYVTELINRLNSLSGQSLSFVALAILKSQPKTAPASNALAHVLTAEKFDPAAVALIEIDKLPVTLFDPGVLLPALERCSQSSNREVRELASKQLTRFTSQIK